jgi:hypothetical protein
MQAVVRLAFGTWECPMKHIELNAHAEAVKQFFLSLPADPDGSVVELNGHVVACVFPGWEKGNGVEDDWGPWTEAKNKRRCALIDKEIDSYLTREEAIELEALQRQMHRYLRALAPLPLEDARRLHQGLLAKAEAARKR